MTDAEKMREAAALLSCPFCGGAASSRVSHDDDHERYGVVSCRECGASVCGDTLHWADNTDAELESQFRAEMGWNRRALPIPVDASAPAADCQQAGLVTVDAGLLDEVKAALVLSVTFAGLIVQETDIGADETVMTVRAMPSGREIPETTVTLAETIERGVTALARLEREVG